MEVPDHSNQIFQLAADFVQHTRQHLFLTGKAGTGKTTFLKYIKENSTKNTVVVAPTGVAAINAGGVTMHSFFQLPFGPFIPDTGRGFAGQDVSDRNTLFKQLRISTEKRDLFQELELLVIDEVSMVRCDMLDAVDTILRFFRKKFTLPFGGVQVLYIGDLFQLPPVIAREEMELLQPYYASPFFFEAKVIGEAPPLYIELKKIYRQNEQRFIDLLNRVRNSAVTEADMELLNSRHQPAFEPPSHEKYIRLCTHNRQTDVINNTELEKLPGRPFAFTGTITGDFSEKALPTEMVLTLKEGAQVMFIRNDTGTDRRYFNGKLATIKSIDPKEEEIIVLFDNEENELKLEKETWRNVQYNYNKESDRIEEEELGSFSQYPIRLAWAITIHKSQGLTFEHAIVDAGASFAAGQVYVALSRCTSLGGLVLGSRIYPPAITTDPRVVAFAQKEADTRELESLLRRESEVFWSLSLRKVFDWSKIIRSLEEFGALVPDKKLPEPEAASRLSRDLLEKARAQAVVAGKFQQQLQQLIDELRRTGDKEQLYLRVSKAIGYFGKAFIEDILKPLQEYLTSLQHASKVKKYRKAVHTLEAFLWQQLQKLTRVTYGDLVFLDDPALQGLLEEVALARKKLSEEKPGREKPAKGNSRQETLAMLREGKTIPEIARLRNLAASTIEGHFAELVSTGDIAIGEFMPEEKIGAILKALGETGAGAIGPVREKLGTGYSYGDIRAVLNHRRRMQEAPVAETGKTK